MISSILGKFQDFMRRPFNPEGDAINWALFIILAVTVAVLWRQTLRSITED